MTKEEKKKQISSLKKMCFSHRPIEITIKSVVNLAKKNAENEILGLMGEFMLNDKRITTLFLPENLKCYTDFYSLKEMEGKTVMAVLTYAKSHNCVYARQLLDKKTIKELKKKNSTPRFNQKKEQEIISNFENFVGKEFDAKIKSFNEYGAVLADDDNVEYFLYDSCFAYGYIPVKRVKNIGDTLRVRLTKCKQEKRSLYVTMVEKYKEESTITADDFEPESVVSGTIVKKTSNLCFVNIAPAIDALCSPIDGFEVGDGVFIQVIGIKDLGNRKTVRGKIVLTKSDDEFKL